MTGSLGRGQRVAAVHDITTVAGTVQGAQVAAQTAARAGLQPTASASANITQKMAAMAGTSALAGGKSELCFSFSSFLFVSLFSPPLLFFCFLVRDNMDQ